MDASATLFDPSRVHEVRLDLSSESLAALRASCNAWERILSQNPECDARVPVRLTVDGTTVDNAGVRLKGGIATWRPVDAKASFSIKTDEFVEDQELFGERRFTVNNEIGDPSFVTESLTYDVFRRAGVPAPRTALANVYLDDEPIGMYVLREAYDKRFLERNFDDADGNLYESPTPATDVANPGLWLRTNERAAHTSDLASLARVVQSVPDAEYRAALAREFDLPELFRYWAAEALTAHVDGYVYNVTAVGREEGPWPNNYYVYHDPSTGRFVILPYGADQSFGTGFTDIPADIPVLLPAKADSQMAVRLWNLPGTSDRLRRTVQRVLDTAWDEPALLARADQIAALVRADGLRGTRETTTMDAFEHAFAARRAFVIGRAPTVRAELAAAAASAATTTTVAPRPRPPRARSDPPTRDPRARPPRARRRWAHGVRGRRRHRRVGATRPGNAAVAGARHDRSRGEPRRAALSGAHSAHDVRPRRGHHDGEPDLGARRRPRLR